MRANSSQKNDVISMPGWITLCTSEKQVRKPLAGNAFAWDDILFSMDLCSDGTLELKVTAEKTPLKYIGLRWPGEIDSGSRVFFDSWERAYGDAGWYLLDPARLMPWYCAIFDGKTFEGYGMQVRPAAFALWSCDTRGVSLWLDVRNGTQAIQLNGRTLNLGKVVYSCCRDKRPAIKEMRDFCRRMCPDPILPTQPVYGSNNWYYAYGNSSHEEILSDSTMVADLASGQSNRPFMVIDDGWQIDYDRGEHSGPWHWGNQRFPAMDKLASEMCQKGVRPGIWVRPLYSLADDILPEMRLNRNGDTRFLDPSHPAVLDLVRQDITRICDWGFELIKHDYTTCDVFGTWGFLMRLFPADGGWHFHDQSKTSAEIMLELYRTIRSAAGDRLILGCNTIGHFGAGLMELSRTGDDTSGIVWERTRRMGVNALAARQPQNHVFFDVDPDCVGITEKVDWKYNRQWAELAARSGQSFFVSLKPGVLDKAQQKELSSYFAIAAKGGDAVEPEPVDWLDSRTPERWSLEDGEKRFDWYGEEGCVPELG